VGGDQGRGLRKFPFVPERGRKIGHGGGRIAPLKENGRSEGEEPDYFAFDLKKTPFSGGKERRNHLFVKSSTHNAQVTRKAGTWEVGEVRS